MFVVELPLEQGRDGQGGPILLTKHFVNIEISLHGTKPKQRIVGDICRELALLGRHVGELEPGNVEQEQKEASEKTSGSPML